VTGIFHLQQQKKALTQSVTGTSRRGPFTRVSQQLCSASVVQSFASHCSQPLKLGPQVLQGRKEVWEFYDIFGPPRLAQHVCMCCESGDVFNVPDCSIKPVI